MINRVFLKTSGLLGIALIMSLSSGISFATPPTRWPQVIESGNPATSGIVYYQLSTGQKLYVKPIHTQPIITVNTWFNVGSVQENAENNGLSHFLEHLIFKGTKTYAKGAIDRIFSEKGADFNATTSKDYTQFYVTVAKPYFKEILDVHADMLVNAAIPEDELKPERLVVQEEINRAMDTPD